MSFFAVGLGLASLLVSPAIAHGQGLNQNGAGEHAKQDIQDVDVAQEIKGPVKVTIQVDKLKGFLAPRALGMASSTGDNHLMDPLMPQILQSAGVTTLRYPGGNYSDHNHCLQTPRNCRGRIPRSMPTTLPITTSDILLP